MYLHIYAQLIFHNDERQFSGKIVFQQVELDKLNVHMQKEKKKNFGR